MVGDSKETLKITSSLQMGKRWRKKGTASR
jgi:hypothetical protein